MRRLSTKRKDRSRVVYNGNNYNSTLGGPGPSGAGGGGGPGVTPSAGGVHHQQLYRSPTGLSNASDQLQDYGSHHRFRLVISRLELPRSTPTDII